MRDVSAVSVETNFYFIALTAAQSHEEVKITKGLILYSWRPVALTSLYRAPYYARAGRLYGFVSNGDALGVCCDESSLNASL